MNLPVILDIALGLIFCYLILSLLASEIQELITTILQWRAEHLKKSIEVLISGSAEESTSEAQTARHLANSLYSHPLLRDLNQEAKGSIEKGFRKISGGIINLIRSLSPNKQNIFGDKNSAPSYIPPEAFARTLIDQLKIKELAQMISYARVEKFKQENLLQQIVEIYQDSELADENKRPLQKEFAKLGESFDEILADFKAQRTTLDGTIDRMAIKVESFIKNCQLILPANDETLETFYNRLEVFRQDNFHESERKALLASLKPSLNEVVQIIAKNPVVYAEFEKIFQDKNSPTYQGIVQLIDSLPVALKQSLSELASRAKTGTLNIEEDIRNLQEQVETWFDRSMTRASGVYKRNAKGVAILIGLVVAIVANADTIHIVSSLSKNSALRAAISQNAQQIVTKNPVTDAESLRALNTQVRRALDDVPLPLGWGTQNINEQAQGNWQIPYLRQFLGWIISGIAISMGSSFWFDLLSKVVNVRNAGKDTYPSKNDNSNT